MISEAHQKLPDVYFVEGDFHSLPFKDNMFSIVVSSAALQWAHDITQVLDEIYRVLKPGGEFHLSFFIEGTFEEFYSVFASAVGINMPPFNFPDQDAVKVWCSTDCVNLKYFVVDEYTEIYSNFSEMIFSLRNCGVNNSPAVSSKMAFSPRRFTALDSAYTQHCNMQEGQVYLRYKALFMRGCVLK